MIKEILVSNEGGLCCKSNFYTSHDAVVSSVKFKFTTGVNMLVGDIDSGIWGMSYLLSMFNRIDIKKSCFQYPLVATVNGNEMPLKELTKHCCYLDQEQYPLFLSKRKTVRQLIDTGVKKSQSALKPNEIIELFALSSERLDRPICYVGNERFRAMAAVGFAFSKQVFCFPWLSKKMFDYYNNNILWLLDTLEKSEAIAIVPVGR